MESGEIHRILVDGEVDFWARRCNAAQTRNWIEVEADMTHKAEASLCGVCYHEDKEGEKE
jgi:hypothetical protein